MKKKILIYKQGTRISNRGPSERSDLDKLTMATCALERGRYGLDKGSHLMTSQLVVHFPYEYGLSLDYTPLMLQIRRIYIILQRDTCFSDPDLYKSCSKAKITQRFHAQTVNTLISLSNCFRNKHLLMGHLEP